MFVLIDEEFPVIVGGAGGKARSPVLKMGKVEKKGEKVKKVSVWKKVKAALRRDKEDEKKAEELRKKEDEARELKRMEEERRRVERIREEEKEVLRIGKEMADQRMWKKKWNRKVKADKKKEEEKKKQEKKERKEWLKERREMAKRLRTEQKRKSLEAEEMTADGGVETAVCPDPRINNRKRRSGGPNLQAVEQPEDLEGNRGPKTRRVRFGRNVAVQRMEREHVLSPNDSRIVISGPNFGPITREKLTRFNPYREERENFVYKARVPKNSETENNAGCRDTCGYEGCTSRCLCIMNGIPCGESFGCDCNMFAVNCSNQVSSSGRPHSGYRARHARNAWAQMEHPSPVSTIESVDNSPTRSVNMDDLGGFETPRTNMSVESVVISPAQLVDRSPIRPIEVPDQLPPSEIDFSTEHFTKKLFAGLLLQFRDSSDCFVGETWLETSALFLALLREASVANKSGKKVGVMHPDIFYRWRGGNKKEQTEKPTKEEIESSVYYRKDIEILLVPLHTGDDKSAHFSLAVLHAKEGRVIIYDSVEQTKVFRQEVIGHLRGIFAEILPEATFAALRIRYGYRNHMDVQEDGYNCGVHTILHARRAAGGKKNLATPKDSEVPLAEILRQIRRDYQLVMLSEEAEYRAILMRMLDVEDLDSVEDVERLIVLPATVKPKLPCPPPPLNRGHRRY